MDMLAVLSPVALGSGLKMLNLSEQSCELRGAPLFCMTKELRGSGKTKSIGKLLHQAYRLLRHGLSVLLSKPGIPYADNHFGRQDGCISFFF